MNPCESLSRRAAALLDIANTFLRGEQGVFMAPQSFFP